MEENENKVTIQSLAELDIKLRQMIDKLDEMDKKYLKSYELYEVGVDGEGLDNLRKFEQEDLKEKYLIPAMTEKNRIITFLYSNIKTKEGQEELTKQIESAVASSMLVKNKETETEQINNNAKSYIDARHLIQDVLYLRDFALTLAAILKTNGNDFRTVLSSLKEKGINPPTDYYYKKCFAIVVREGIELSEDTIIDEFYNDYDYYKNIAHKPTPEADAKTSAPKI